MSRTPTYLDLITPRPIEEYHEDMGDVLWWCFEQEKRKCSACDGYGEIGAAPNNTCSACGGAGHLVTGLKLKGEPPYVGSPNDTGFEVMVNIEASIWTFPNKQVGRETTNQFSRMVGGWPGYHTHFTPLPMVQHPPQDGQPK